MASRNIFIPDIENKDVLARPSNKHAAAPRLGLTTRSNNIDTAVSNLPDKFNKVLSVAKPTPKLYGGRRCCVPVEDARDIDQYIIHLQSAKRLESDYMDGLNVTGKMRMILVDWMILLHYKLQMSNETLYLSCCLLDRVMRPLLIDKDNFQSLGLACLFVASKFEDVAIPHVNDILSTSSDICDLSQLFELERQILKALNFNLAFAYPKHFLRKARLLASPDMVFAVEMSNLFAEIALMDQKMSLWLPSIIAAASIYVSFEVCKLHVPSFLIEQIGVSMEDAANSAKLMLMRVPIYMNKENKLNGFQRKYQGNSYFEKIAEFVKC